MKIEVDLNLDSLDERHRKAAYAALLFVLLGFVPVGTRLVDHWLLNFVVMSMAMLLLLASLVVLVHQIWVSDLRSLYEKHNKD